MVTAKESVEYDGYYFVDAVAKSGHKVTIPARGYNLRYWINFEKSLGSTVEYRAVSEKEWMTTHWTQTPYEELPVTKKPAMKTAKKPAAKKSPAKKAVVKKAPDKKAAKKTSKPKKTT
jgi:cell division septation protein DedD